MNSENEIKGTGNPFVAVSVRGLQPVRLNSPNGFSRKKLPRLPAAYEPLWKFADRNLKLHKAASHHKDVEF